MVAVALVAVALLVGASAPRAQQPQQPQQPFGVFAKVDVDYAVQKRCTHPQQVHSCLQGLYGDLLLNRAISGLTIGIHWNELSLSHLVRTPDGDGGWNWKWEPNGYDWSWLDDALEVAGPQGRPVQLNVTPGFDSPKWLFERLTPCDTLFTEGGAPFTCGSLQFSKFPESQHTDGNNVLPLPWPSNDYFQGYLDYWWQFLSDLKSHVQHSRYPASLAAIAMAGPTSGSAEIIMPVTGNAQLAQAKHKDVDTAWNDVIVNAVGTLFSQDEENTDQPFIDAWFQTIQHHQATFPGVALIISPDGGGDLPRYGLKQATKHGDDKKLFDTICANFDPKGPDAVSCEAKAEILAQFASAQTGDNLYAIQIGGIKASSPLVQGNIGVPAAQCLSTPDCYTGLNLNPTASFLGGGAFDYAATSTSAKQQQKLGCPVYPAVCSQFNLSPELIAFNVYAVFFNNTVGEDNRFVTTLTAEIAMADPTSARGTEYIANAPLPLMIRYIDVPYRDILYAGLNHECPQEWDPFIGWMSMQDLLNQAQYKLSLMTSNPLPTPVATCPNGPPVSRH
jgi:hypothetical protein